ncbi:MAG: winged helix-turn-helix transcriptional regulator [Ignavibacteria bacterium]|nr:winged helix-turn-helix transcriptional regulator [Ignavibacteria bacterium]
MAVSKKNIFSKKDQKLADYAKALSHPARVAIVKFLAEKNVCMCGEIVDELPLAQSTVSQHLRELKRANIIKGEIEGPKVCYCLNPDVIAELINIFNELFSCCPTEKKK